MIVSNPNNVKIYNLSAGKSLPEVCLHPFKNVRSKTNKCALFAVDGGKTESKIQLEKELRYTSTIPKFNALFIYELLQSINVKSS